MNILTICGSTRKESQNAQLLKAIAALLPHHTFVHFELTHIPLFHPDVYDLPLPDEITKWKKSVAIADAIIISTPEYLHNIPAVLKNALEWLTQSGELAHKAVLPITFTPHHPRGEKAMQSLLWSLLALESRVVTSLQLFHTDISIDGNLIAKGDGIELIKEAVGLLD